MKEKVLFWEVLFVISSVPTSNYLSKVSNWSTRIRSENCSRLRMKTLERYQWRRSSVYIVNYKHISNFLLIIGFQQANVLPVHIEKTKTFEDKIRYIHALFVVLISDQNLLTNNIWSYTMTVPWVNQWEIFAKECTSDIDSG